jgi:histidinol-phosphate/aromatic aminotransferase/cobyric acid decarboxylase-like protein
LGVVGVALEDDGPDLARLEAVLAAERPRFLYLIPDFQNPSGTTCSAEKRRRIAALSERDNLLIVEDAPYRPLRYRGKEEPSLHSLAPERTIYMSSFSKLVGPGPRVGYMVGPAKLIAALAKAAEDTYICPNNLAHGIAFEWCRSGALPVQIEKLKLAESRKVYATGDLTRTTVLLDEMEQSVDMAENSLKDTNKDPSRSPKYFKSAEIKTGDLLRKIDAFARDMNAADRHLADDLRAGLAGLVAHCGARGGGQPHGRITVRRAELQDALLSEGLTVRGLVSQARLLLAARGTGAR